MRMLLSVVDKVCLLLKECRNILIIKLSIIESRLSHNPTQDSIINQTQFKRIKVDRKYILIVIKNMTEIQTQRRPPPFLLKIYEMLENQQHRQQIAWNDQGNGFTILCSQQFQSMVLPRYFKHSKTHSFIRQLNMYGFSKRKEAGSFYHHPHFRRGHRNAISLIQRKVQNKTLHKSKRQSAPQPPSSPHQQELLQLNTLLFREQVANLTILLQDYSTSTNEELFQVVEQYKNIHNGILSRLREDCDNSEVASEEGSEG